MKVLLVTGGLGDAENPGTETYQDGAWRTVSYLPLSQNVWGTSAITLKNRVLLFGNDYNCTYKSYTLKLF